MSTTTFKAIRAWLELSQQALGEALGEAQSNVSSYETGKIPLSASVATKLIDVAKARGLAIDFNHVFGDAPLPPKPEKPKPPEKPKRPRGRPRKNAPAQPLAPVAAAAVAALQPSPTRRRRVVL